MSKPARPIYLDYNASTPIDPGGRGHAPSGWPGSGTDILECPADGPFDASVDLHPCSACDCPGCVLSSRAGRISAVRPSPAP